MKNATVREYRRRSNTVENMNSQSYRSVRPLYLRLRDRRNYKESAACPITKAIPAIFFWDIGVRFLSWECWDFWGRHIHFWRFPKKSEVFRRSLKSSKDVRSPSPSLGMPINTSSLPVLQRSWGRYCHLFILHMVFVESRVWVNILLEIMSSKMATIHIFQSGARNWPTSVSRRATEVSNS